MPALKAKIANLSDDAKFGAGADQGGLAAIETNLGVEIPSALREFLKEADGVTCDHGAGVVWPVQKIESENLAFRSNPDFQELYMPFVGLLFFADDGGGDQFAFAIHADGKIHKNDVFRWQHESDSRAWFATGLDDYVAKRLSEAYYD